MYQVGHRLRHHYLRYGIAVTVLVVLAAVGVAGGRVLLQPHTTLVQSNPVVNHVGSGSASYRHWAASRYEIDLPDDWAVTAPPATAYRAFSYHGTTASSSARRLDIYIDTVPTDLAVNRLLPVQSEDDHLLITGVTSDNCVNFTDKTPAAEKSGTAVSKWAGVNFLCDMGNYERHVAAIGSKEGVNTVTLTGAKAGSLRVLLVYTDNNSSPDYSAFITIAKSFRLL